MQTDGHQIDRIVAELQRGRAGGPPSPPPLNPAGGGGNFDPMEPRVAKLEAHMEHVRSELGKLAGVPADLATVKERTGHLPTKAEMQSEVSAQMERLGSRLQRQFTITGAIFTGILATITLALRFIG